ncbi:hypothetical protein [Nocardia tengchongensis]|uniref:hypothetical protein n=1 Tax=Nocardia tengchongensis TaxID=2055889 RepID=UPI00360F2A95
MVAVYELDGNDGWERVAEFRLSAANVVELFLFGERRCPLALHWYRAGIETPATAPPVTVSDGPRFMRALLRPYQMSYCRLVDESGDHHGVKT